MAIEVTASEARRRYVFDVGDAGCEELRAERERVADEARVREVRIERAARVGEQERALRLHDPTTWASLEERRRLVAYWAFLGAIGGMRR